MLRTQAFAKTEAGDRRSNRVLGEDTGTIDEGTVSARSVLKKIGWSLLSSKAGRRSRRNCRQILGYLRHPHQIVPGVPTEGACHLLRL